MSKLLAGYLHADGRKSANHNIKKFMDRYEQKFNTQGIVYDIDNDHILVDFDSVWAAKYGPPLVSYTDEGTACFKTLYRVKPDMYYVKNQHLLVGFRHKEVALYCALHVKNMELTGKYNKMTLKAGLLDHSTLCLVTKEKVKLVPDRDYNEAAGIQNVEEKTVYWEQLPKINQDSVVDECVYSKFVENVDLLMNTAVRGVDHFKKMGSAQIGSFICDAGSSVGVHIAHTKRHLTPSQWVDETIKTRYFYSCCFQVPKPTSIKSDGKVRVICAPTPHLEATLRLLYRHCSPKVYCNYVSDQRKAKFKSNVFDIASADMQIGPYWNRYLDEHPLYNKEIHYPKVIGIDGKPYRTQCLPSGVLHTSMIGAAFTKAVADACNIKEYQFQGDSIMTDEHIDLDSVPVKLNKVADFNGFKVIDGQVKFANTYKLLLPAFKRRGVTGRLRYLVRWKAYQQLNAHNLNMAPRPRGADMTIKQVLKMIGPNYPLTKLERMAFGIGNDPQNSNNDELTVFSPERTFLSYNNKSTKVHLKLEAKDDLQILLSGLKI